jgi:NAD(P)-dependent dehydrogenase (short-subunit alcohol dehydrogenase family)
MNPHTFDPMGDARSEFSGKRVLVTGGTKGAGEAIVRRLAAGGATVATTARSGRPEGLPVSVFIEADLSTVEGAASVAETVLRELGGADSRIGSYPVARPARDLAEAVDQEAGNIGAVEKVRNIRKSICSYS